MPESGECVHSVDFDKLEIVSLKRKKYKIRVGCGKCGTEITLDDVLGSLAKKVYNLNSRLLAIEPKEKDDGESVPGADT